MANLYNPPATCSSSSSPPETTDDISMFLRQILLKSSSSTSYSSSSIVTKQMQCEIPPLQPVYSSGLSVIDRIPNFFSPTSAYTPTNTVTYDDDPDEYDCESEEGFEDLMEQMAVKSNRHRNPSKRARAAEDHNLSEKRRRSRINEKMKALQKLIPNSNKTDKASMLDEAIEYLKQLQLRLQMLTMRNGMNLYVPPGVLQPQQLPYSRIGLHEPGNITSPNQDTRVSPMLSLPIQRTNRNHPSIPELSHISNPGSSSSFRESLMNSSGSEGGQLMNTQQKLVLPVGLDRNCTRNESCDDAKR